MKKLKAERYFNYTFVSLLLMFSIGRVINLLHKVLLPVAKEQKTK